MMLTQVKGRTWVAEDLELIPFYRLPVALTAACKVLDVHPKTARRAMGPESSMRFFVGYLVDRGDLGLCVMDQILPYVPGK